MEFFATCPTGFEHLLANELASFGLSQVRPLQGQVAFAGPLRDAYVACLWSHLASRVVAVLCRVDAHDSQELYERASKVAWEDHIPPTSTFAVNAQGTNAQLRNTQFVAVRVKDAIADRLFNQRGTREAVDTRRPDVSVAARLSKNRLTLGIDLSGTPLFNRGRTRGGQGKGLRPDYAAALLAMGGWGNVAKPSDSLLAFAQYPDPILVEAALMAAHAAPGLPRPHWGFQGWGQHDADAWQHLVEDARAAAKGEVPQPLVALPLSTGPLRAKGQLRSMGIDANIALSAAGPNPSGEGTLLAADLSDIRSHELVREASLLARLAQVARDVRPAHAVLATRDSLADSYLGQQAKETTKSILGKDDLLLRHYAEPLGDAELATVEASPQTSVPVLVPSSDQFAARLRKVAKLRAMWAKREDVTCYRLYDSDLPDYAVSIDLYQGTDPRTGDLDGNRWLQIYEYAPPKDVDATLARSRLMDVLALAPAILQVKPNNTYLRIRRRDKGGSQYASEARHTQAYVRPRKDGAVPLPEGAHLIDEGGLVFEVNFDSRLDCGIFLDHRETRAMLREMAKQTKGSKRFLNLFAYTGTATCYAADGGMRHTTTVDLSRPSLDWARRNMARNGFTGSEHEFVQADVVSWISEQRHTKNRWDLVFCDVPTFSNSNRMGRKTFDVQRDHAELLIGVSRLLTRNGSCVFSCNLRSFKPNEEALRKAGVVIEDITAQTIPEDFARNQRIHKAYIVRRG